MSTTKAGQASVEAAARAAAEDVFAGPLRARHRLLNAQMAAQLAEKCYLRGHAARDGEIQAARALLRRAREALAAVLTSDEELQLDADIRDHLAAQGAGGQPGEGAP